MRVAFMLGPSDVQRGEPDIEVGLIEPHSRITDRRVGPSRDNLPLQIAPPPPLHHPEQRGAQYAGRAGPQLRRPQRQAHHWSGLRRRFWRPLALALLGALSDLLEARRQVVG